MRSVALLVMICLFSGTVAAQTEGDAFKGCVRNEEYNIYITMNFSDKDVLVPGQEVLGEVCGYIGSGKCKHVWFITSAEVTDGKTARIEVINNYGSEDFTAKLSLNRDGTYTLKHTGGSTLKFPVDGKWQKIPGSVVFAR